MSTASASGRRGAAGLGAAHLQPEDGDLDADSAELRARATRIDRLAGDRDLIGQLRLHGFVGPDWDEAAAELVRYAMAVIKSWTWSGMIFEKCAEKNRPVKRPRIDNAFDENEAESMAGEVITVALEQFRRDVLLADRWDPARGASLTTYFVGLCVLCFPNIYRAWLPSVPPSGWDEYDTDRMGTGGLPLEDQVIQQRMNADALVLVRNADAREALVLVGMGYTQPQIAARLGTTPKAVERMLDYARKQVAKKKRTA